MIRYVTGDATDPIGHGPWMVAHVVNNIGRYGAGFSKAVLKKWPHVYQRFGHMDLGEVAFRIGVDNPRRNRLVVAHMCAQDGVGTDRRRIVYHALEDCLRVVKVYAEVQNCTVHMPRIGCGLAGGDWAEVERIINAVGLDCTIYDLA